jgi:hypothetical protein
MSDTHDNKSEELVKDAIAVRKEYDKHPDPELLAEMEADADANDEDLEKLAERVRSKHE